MWKSLQTCKLGLSKSKDSGPITSIVCYHFSIDCHFGLFGWIVDFHGCCISPCLSHSSAMFSLSDDSGQRCSRSLQSRFQEQPQSLTKPAICVRHFQTTLGYVSKRLRNHALCAFPVTAITVYVCMLYAYFLQISFLTGKNWLGWRTVELFEDMLATCPC